MPKLNPLHKPTRIKYGVELDGLCSRPVLAGADLVFIRIYYSPLRYEIIKLEGLKVLSYAPGGNNLNATKKAAKERLIELGATFDGEVRRRKPLAKPI